MARKRAELAPPTTPPAPYQRKKHEEAAVERWRKLRDEYQPLPSYAVRENGSVTFDHADPPLAALIVMEALGITAHGQYMAIINQVISATSRDGKPNADGINGVISFAAGMKPTNPIEAMLAIQAATVHQLTMSEAGKLRRADLLPQYEAYSTTLNKLARTFTTQVETLKKLRSGGPQRVVVEHQHYHLHQTPEAAAAAAGGGVEIETEHQSHVRSIPEREAVLGYLEADAAAVSRAGNDR